MAWDAVTEGWTASIPFQLTTTPKGETVAVPYDLTGMTVTLLLKTFDGRPVYTAGNVTVTNAAEGRVAYTPNAGDLHAKDSPYLGRFKVSIGGTDIFFPPGPEETLPVYAP